MLETREPVRLRGVCNGGGGVGCESKGGEPTAAGRSGSVRGQPDRVTPTGSPRPGQPLRRPHGRKGAAPATRNDTTTKMQAEDDKAASWCVETEMADIRSISRCVSHHITAPRHGSMQPTPAADKCCLSLLCLEWHEL